MSISMELEFIPGDNELSNLLASTLINPGNNKKAIEHFNKAVVRALKSTSYIFLKFIKSGIFDNAFGFPEPNVYSNWFGRAGPVNISGLLKANKPMLKAYKDKRAGKKIRKEIVINQPKEHKPWGGLRRLMQYHVDETAQSAKIGMIPERRGSAKWADIFLKMQEGGGGLSSSASGSPISKSNWGYFGALGLYMRRTTVFKLRPRPLMEKSLDAIDPIETLRELFLAKLAGKGKT
jgi:hypothetical protein